MAAAQGSKTQPPWGRTELSGIIMIDVTSLITGGILGRVRTFSACREEGDFCMHNQMTPRNERRRRHVRWSMRLAAIFALLIGGIGIVASQPVSAAGTQEMTILVLGVSAPPDTAIDVGNRPTSISVMHIDRASGQCATLAIPSASLVELPGYGETRIRHALMVGGIPFQQLVTEIYLGIDIDQYVLVDFTGFQELVDAAGGITVDISPDLTSPAIPTAGRQTINGAQALAHARYGGNDIFLRLQRQQELIRGIVESLDGVDLLTKANDITPAVRDHLRTDFDLQELVEVGKYLRDNCSGDAMQTQIIPGTSVYGSIVDPLFDVPLEYIVSTPEDVQASVDTLLGN